MRPLSCLSLSQVILLAYGFNIETPLFQIQIIQHNTSRIDTVYTSIKNHLDYILQYEITPQFHNKHNYNVRIFL